MAIRTAAEALAFIEKHGVVLQAARGPLPNLVEAIAGETIGGSWWGLRLGSSIYAILEQVSDSPEVLVCKLAGGKVTLIHRRLWPALVRLADTIGRDRLAAVDEEHTPSGSHRSVRIEFPRWVPADVMREAASLSEAAARAMLADALNYLSASRSPRRRNPSR